MKKVLWSLLLAIISLPMMAQTNHVSVSGNTFVDENGDAIIFRGLCASDPVKLARQKKWNEKYFAEADSSSSICQTRKRIAERLALL